jgi:CelD/BcsL family acetyltransferase involved in cellulose biosynthesis
VASLGSGLALDVLRSDNAVGTLSESRFLEEWKELASIDPKCTWFQEPAFVLDWYQAYRAVAEPLIVLARDEGGRLEGLMCLALMDGGRRLCHAGDHHTEYHGWIGRPESEERFVVEAVNRVMETYRPKSWRFRYLPPRAPVDWLRRLSPRIGVSHQVVSVPIWDLTDTARLERKLKKGRVRNYINRYRRRGELVYERIESPARIRAALEQLALWCDLRQGAANGVLPFGDDPRKLPFHEALAHRPNSVVFSALRLSERFLSIHLGGFDGDELFLGVQGHDPVESALSPGTILLYEMASDLAERGARLVDLTPGGDPWKERYATGHREIHSVELFRSNLLAEQARATDTLSRLASTAARRAGLEPSRIRAAVRSVLSSESSRLARETFAIGAESLGVVSSTPAVVAHPKVLLGFPGKGVEERRRFFSEASKLMHEGWTPVGSMPDRDRGAEIERIAFVKRDDVEDVEQGGTLFVRLAHESSDASEPRAWLSAIAEEFRPEGERVLLSISPTHARTFAWAKRTGAPSPELPSDTDTDES